MREGSAHIFNQLQQEILRLQGFKPPSGIGVDMGLGSINSSFPNSIFPLGAIHELLTEGHESMASTSGFVAALLSPLMKKGGTAMWISANRKLFPPALKRYGIDPDKIIFVDVRDDKQVTWCVDEALKCPALTAVIGEMRNLDFTVSRRLQLAVEQSKVTGFILYSPRKLNTTASVTRWRITSLPGQVLEDLPGLGFSNWKVELLRVRNGKPGVWNVQWSAHGLEEIRGELLSDIHHLQTG